MKKTHSENVRNKIRFSVAISPGLASRHEITTPEMGDESFQGVWDIDNFVHVRVLMSITNPPDPEPLGGGF